jgi:hypothetical protein
MCVWSQIATLIVWIGDCTDECQNTIVRFDRYHAQNHGTMTNLPMVASSMPCHGIDENGP